MGRVNADDTGTYSALIGFVQQHQSAVLCRTVLGRAAPDRMVGEICEVLHLTFGANLQRAVRCLLSRDWAEIDTSTIGLYPTLATPAEHPLVAGVGVAADERRGQALKVHLSCAPPARWAYLLMAGAERLRVLEAHGGRWREIHRYSARECELRAHRTP
jgi:hypothetical protein